VRGGTTANLQGQPYLVAGSFVLGMLALILAWRLFGWVIEEKQALVAGILGSAGLVLSHLIEELLLPGLVLSNVAFAALTLFFGLVVASLRSPRDLLLSLVVALVVTVVAVGTIQLVLPDTSYLAVALLPLLTSVFLASGGAPLRALLHEDGHRRKTGRGLSSRPARRKEPLIALVAASVGYILCSLLSGITEKQLSLSSSTTLLMYVLSVALVVLFLLLFKRALRPAQATGQPDRQRVPPPPENESLAAVARNGKVLGGLWPFFVTLLVFSLLCFSSVFSIGEDLSYAIAFACLNTFYFGFLILGPVLIRICSLSFVPAYGIFSIACYGFFWRNMGGYLVAQEMTALSAQSIGSVTVLFLLACSIVVVSVYIRRLAVFVDETQKDDARRKSERLSEQDSLDALALAHGITAREQEVCGLLLKGYSASKIAARLFVSESTVRFHLRNSYRKLGIHSKQELLDLIGTQRS
jgi:DNA-binding CsgD family transcriptional regulator